MNAEKEKEIARLAIEAFRATEKAQALGMRNSAVSREEAESLAVLDALAKADMFAARAALNRAIEGGST